MAYVELQSGTVLETDDTSIWPEAKKLSNADGKRRLHDEALEYLRSILKPGDTVYTNVTHVSRSGMSRNIQVFVIRDNEPQNVSGYVGRVLSAPVDRKELSVKVGGCGMDMGFHVVHNLGYALFPDGFSCIGDKCPSNDHSNGDRNRKPHNHSSGAYALRQRWL